MHSFQEIVIFDLSFIMTIEPKIALVSWSGGKDSAFALYSYQAKNTRPIVLHTTLNQQFNRIAMHGVKEQLLDLQAEAVGLPLRKIYIPDHCTNEDYERVMKVFFESFRAGEIEEVVYGDLFLEDIRKYRESALQKVGLLSVFPLWQEPTVNIALEFIRKGFKAILTCVDTKVLDASFCGREYTLDLLSDLPAQVDPCGENGEFHTFVYDGPNFKQAVPFLVSELRFYSGQFCYADLQ